MKMNKMKMNKIISFVIVCAVFLSCIGIPAFAATTETVVETIGMTSGNTNIASISETTNGSGVWKAITADTVGSDEGDKYANAGNARFRLGTVDKSQPTNISLTQDEDGNWSADTIVRYRFNLKSLVNATRFDFWTYYYLDDVLKSPTAVYPKKPAESSIYSPASGDEFLVDIVVDLNTLTSYFYLDNELCGSHTLTPPEETKNIKFASGKFYFGDSKVTSGGVELCEVSNINKYTYPAGTTINSVQNEITDVLRVMDVVPETLANWRWTVPENSTNAGTYDLTMVHDKFFHGGIGIPFGVNFSDGTTGLVKVEATIKAIRNFNFGGNKINAVYKRDGSIVGNYELNGVGTPLTISKLSKGTYKFEAIADKSTKTVYYYINGRLKGSNSYIEATTDTDDTEIVLEYLGLYLGTVDSVPEDNTVFAQISNVKRHLYPSTMTLNALQAEVSRISYMPASYSVRSGAIATGVDAEDGYTVTVKETVGTSNSGVQLSTRVSVPETINFASSTDKYVALGSKLKIAEHKNSNFMSLAVEGTGSRTQTVNFRIDEGETYDVTAIIDVRNKKVYFYLDNVLIGEHTTSLTELGHLIYFFSEFEEPKNGFAAGEETITLSDAYTNYYSANYTGTLEDVVAAEIGTDIENMYLGTCGYTPWKEGDSGYGTETHRVFAYIYGFDATKHRCYIVGYNTDESGNEVMTFATPVEREYTLLAKPYGSFDKIKVFIWNTDVSPVYKAYELSYCIR